MFGLKARIDRRKYTRMHPVSCVRVRTRMTTRTTRTQPVSTSRSSTACGYRVGHVREHHTRYSSMFDSYHTNGLPDTWYKFVVFL